MARSQIAILAAVLGATLAVAAASTEATVQHLRRLKHKTDTNLFRGNGAFVDGTETVYDDFSLAWRFLGFYKDCNVCFEDDKAEDDNGNQYEVVQNPKECVRDGADATVCRNYALWAAYVDENYSGNGFTEYRYYDRESRRWSDCADSDYEDSRCVKMDCHSPSSKNFKLVGVYKDHRTDVFLENLVGYSGDCVWNDDEYKFMQEINANNGVWPPKECTAYQNGYYYNAVPSSKGNLDVALFTDDACTEPYDGRRPKTKDVVDPATIESWNGAMDALKVCQPCLSYETLVWNEDEGDAYNADGTRYQHGNEQANEGDDAEEEEGEGDIFVCKDNLDQDEPVNQCQVLVEGNTLAVATYRDILLAESQGTVTGIDLSPASESKRGKMVMGEPFTQKRHKWLSILLFVLSIGYFGYALKSLFDKDRSKSEKRMREPLFKKKEETATTEKKQKKKKFFAVASKSKKEKSNDTEQKKQEKKKSKSILKKSSSRYEEDEEDDSSHYSGL